MVQRDPERFRGCTCASGLQFVCFLSLLFFPLFFFLSVLMGSLKVGSVNGNGARDRGNADMLKDKQISVCFLQTNIMKQIGGCGG